MAGAACAAVLFEQGQRTAGVDRRRRRGGKKRRRRMGRMVTIRMEMGVTIIMTMRIRLRMTMSDLSLYAIVSSVCVQYSC